MKSPISNAYSYAIIVAMGGFIFGLDAALISGTIRFITAEFALTDLQLGTVVSADGLGVVAALPFVGYIINRIGRKRTIECVSLLYIISALASTFAQNYETLVVARFIGGLAFSSISMAAMYIGEIAPPQRRGRLVAILQINMVVGLSGAYFINHFILQASESGWAWVARWGMEENIWRWMLGTELLPAILWIFLLTRIPESPAWYAYKGRMDEARSVLHKILPKADVEPHIEEMQESLAKSESGGSVLAQLKAIFSSPMRTIFIVAITLGIAQQSTGINAILFYAPTVFEQAGTGTSTAFEQAVWIGIISIICTSIGLLIVDRIGRRPMVLGGMIWIIVSLAVCSYGFKQARYSLDESAIEALVDFPDVERLRPLVGVNYESDLLLKEALEEVLGAEDARNHSSELLQQAVHMNAQLILLGILSFIGAFQMTVGPVMWVLFSEIFPIALRGVAIPFFTIITSLTSFLVQKFFPWQLANMGVSTIFLFYASTVAIGLVILSFFLKETKNMSIEEIQDVFAVRERS